MHHRAVGNRCAIDLNRLHVHTRDAHAWELLLQKGFRNVEVDLIALARTYVGHAQYKREARMHEAPDVVDCSSFTKWLYGQRGIWLPRRSIQQREYGEPVERAEVTEGDLLFSSSWKNFDHGDPAQGVGHVGIATAEHTVIHATYHNGVNEIPLKHFIQAPTFRGARRYILYPERTVTVEIPLDIEVETADDIYWMMPTIR